MAWQVAKRYWLADFENGNVPVPWWVGTPHWNPKIYDNLLDAAAEYTRILEQGYPEEDLMLILL